jgi:hypothetical protein
MSEPFDYKSRLITVQGGRQYLPAAARIAWMRSEHPDWAIETEIVYHDTERHYAVVRATVKNADGRTIGQGTKSQDAKSFKEYIEKAETSAIGRALAVCGYGTEQTHELDDVPQGRQYQQQNNYRQPAENATYACSNCGLVIKQREHEYSIKQMGCALCMDCQGDVRSGKLVLRQI